MASYIELFVEYKQDGIWKNLNIHKKDQFGYLENTIYEVRTILEGVLLGFNENCAPICEPKQSLDKINLSAEVAEKYFNEFADIWYSYSSWLTIKEIKESIHYKDVKIKKLIDLVDDIEKLLKQNNLELSDEDVRIIFWIE